MALDPADHTVADLEDALADVDDADELAAILEAERDGKDRKTAVAAIEARLEAVGGDAGADEDEAAEDEEAGDDETTS